MQSVTALVAIEMKNIRFFQSRPPAQRHPMTAHTHFVTRSHISVCPCVDSLINVLYVQFTINIVAGKSGVSPYLYFRSAFSSFADSMQLTSAGAAAAVASIDKYVPTTDRKIYPLTCTLHSNVQSHTHTHPEIESHIHCCKMYSNTSRPRVQRSSTRSTLDPHAAHTLLAHTHTHTSIHTRIPQSSFGDSVLAHCKLAH